MKTISIKVPNWVPTQYELRQYKQKIKMWLFPPRCVDCKKRVKARSFYWKHKRTGTHPLGIKHIVDTFGMRVNRTSCPTCMKKYLHTIDKKIGNCTICEARNVETMGYTYIKQSNTFITFLWAWWNGSDFCTPCVDDMLDNGNVATDVYENGKPVYY